MRASGICILSVLNETVFNLIQFRLMGYLGFEEGSFLLLSHAISTIMESNVCAKHSKLAFWIHKYLIFNKIQ